MSTRKTTKNTTDISTSDLIAKPKRQYNRKKKEDSSKNVEIVVNKIIEPIEEEKKNEIIQSYTLHDNSVYNWENGAWKILKLMMNEPKFLIQHQIASFNEFLDKGIRNVIAQFNTIVLNYDFVTKQKFYRVKDNSSYSTSSNNEWNGRSLLTQNAAVNE
jgi:hypothetical protein